MSVRNYSCDHPFLKMGPLLWQRGVRLLTARNPGDVLVICGDLHLVSNFPLILKAKMRGVGVVWWGHHRTAGAVSWRVKLRVAITRMLADCILCYTDEGVRFFESMGVAVGRLFATGNTVDFDPIDAAVAAWLGERVAAFRQEQGLEGKRVLLFCGVLREKTRLDIAIRALSHAAMPCDVVLAVIGDGAMMDEYKHLATDLGVADRVIWVGRLLDQQKMAPWFLSSQIFVYPGSIGLSIMHAFGYGLPVVTHGTANNQMPEYEAFEDGKTGVAFREGDQEDFVQVILARLDDPVQCGSMGKYAKQKVHAKYSMQQMQKRFAECVLTCSAASAKKGKT